MDASVVLALAVQLLVQYKYFALQYRTVVFLSTLTAQSRSLGTLRPARSGCTRTLYFIPFELPNYFPTPSYNTIRPPATTVSPLLSSESMDLYGSASYRVLLDEIQRTNYSKKP